MNASLLQPLLSSASVARLVGVEVETLGAWRRKGFGPRWYRIGKRVMYDETDLRIWINARAQCGQATGVVSTNRGPAVAAGEHPGKPTFDLQGQR